MLVRTQVLGKKNSYHPEMILKDAGGYASVLCKYPPILHSCGCIETSVFRKMSGSRGSIPFGGIVLRGNPFWGCCMLKICIFPPLWYRKEKKAREIELRKTVLVLDWTEGILSKRNAPSKMMLGHSPDRNTEEDWKLESTQGQVQFRGIQHPLTTPIPLGTMMVPQWCHS